MRSVLLVSVCALLVCVSALGTGAVAAQSTGDDPQLVYDISVDEHGDATWVIQAQFPINSAEDANAFEELAEIYEEDGGEVYLPLEPYELAVDQLDNMFDRSMSISGGERTVEQTEDMGILSVSFDWEGFALAEGDRVEVGDVFASDGQSWFTQLEANERIALHAPEGYSVQSSGLPVQNGTMTATGPTNLEPGDLQGTFVDGGAGSPIPPLVGGLLGLVGLVIVVFVFLYLRGWEVMERTGKAEEPTAPSPDNDEPVADPVFEDAELLGDEERVMALIQQHDGRMKQANIVTETDWSNAKVSQLLSQMAEDGEIEKLRIGRENLIRLPDENDT